MAGNVRIGIIGDHEPDRPSHKATEEALEHAAKALDVAVEAEWLPTVLLEGRGVEAVNRFDALWCAPGSPYKSLNGALEAVRFVREQGQPFIGTCGGFQHVVIEYARNVLGFRDAHHAEYDPYASNLFITPLSCSLAGRKMRVDIRPDSKIYDFYGKSKVEEEYRCDFGIDQEHQNLVEEGGLCVVGVDQNGEARILELPDHDFYVATLFVPQMSSSTGHPHPLVVAFLEAALRARGEPEEARSEAQ